MNFENFSLFFKNIKNYLSLTIIIFIVSFALNFLLANKNQYVNPLSQYHAYVIIIFIFSAIVLSLILTNKFFDWKNNKKLFSQYDCFLENLSEEEKEIIDVLKNGVTNINPTILKCKNTTKINVLKEKKIVKIISEGSFKQYKSYICDLSDEYKAYLKKLN